MPVLTEPTHMFGIVYVPLCLPGAGGNTTVTARLSPSSPKGAEPLPKSAHLGAFIRVSS
jgi:hypothetical protein